MLSLVKCEYIEGSSGQYLDTGVTPSTNTKVIIDVKSLSEEKTGCIFGSRYSGMSFVLFALGTDNSSQSSYRFDKGSANYSVDISSFNRHLVTIEPNSIKIDDNVTTIPATTVNSNYNMYLFSVNNSGVADERSGVRIYSCQIYSGDTLVRDYRPYINDGVPGMYDVLNKIFYSSKGTPLIAGPIIKSGFTVNINGEWKESDEAYVNVNGQWKVIDSIYVNVNGEWKSSL